MTKMCRAAYLDVINVVPVPGGAEKFVAKSQDKDILDHLLAQIMINAIDFVFFPVGSESFLKFPRTGKIFAKRLLNLIARWLGSCESA